MKPQVSKSNPTFSGLGLAQQMSLNTSTAFLVRRASEDLLFKVGPGETNSRKGF